MSPTSARLNGKIRALKFLTRNELCERFSIVYRQLPPRRLSRQLLIRSIAYQIQEDTLEAADRDLAKRLKTMAIALQETGQIDVGHLPPVKLGTRLIREWKGTTHEVIVTRDGFIYRAEQYRSLSQIARLITGARWSGPRFFGLRKRVAQSSKRHGG